MPASSPARCADRKTQPDRVTCGVGNEADNKVYNPFQRRMTPLWQALMVRVFDLWVHEQDIREAVGRPGNLASPGSAIVRELFLLAERVLAGLNVAP
jgi:hypothetical protein